MRQDVGGEDVLADDRLARDYSDAMKTAARVNPVERQAPTLPVYGDMGARSRAQSHGGTEKQRMVDLAYRLGAHTGNRVGELAQDKIAPHALTCDGVVFFDQSGHPHPAWDVAVTLPRASRAVTVQLSWPTTKVGPRTTYITRVSVEETQLLEDIHQWSCRRLIMSGHPFFRCEGTGGTLALHKRMVAAHVKDLATQCGLQASAFSPRSMRVGVATAVRAANGSKAEADAAGGWSTKASTAKRYARATPQTDPGRGVTWRDLVIMQTASVQGPKRLAPEATVSRVPTGR
jgi:hypothetical protein